MLPLLARTYTANQSRLTETNNLMTLGIILQSFDVPKQSPKGSSSLCLPGNKFLTSEIVSSFEELRLL